MFELHEHHREQFIAKAEMMLESFCRVFGIEDCESPIEAALFRGFVARYLYNRTWRFASYTPRVPIETEYSATVHIQHRVKHYRLDFAIEVRLPNGSIRWIAVECDGHDFHERTPEQATRDKKRDRDLSLEGFTVLRFTGKEIYANPFEKAAEIEALIGSWVSA